MTNSRAKGANFEREIAANLEAELGFKFKRELNQYREKNLGDLICDDPAFPWSIECKRYAKGGFQNKWWEQAKSAANFARKMPCVIYRFDRDSTRVAIPLSALWVCENSRIIDVSFETFCYITREIMNG